ncbi:MAG: hypothetical protein AAF310_05890 [Myxococcota bacterium]
MKMVGLFAGNMQKNFYSLYIKKGFIMVGKKEMFLFAKLLSFELPAGGNHKVCSQGISCFEPMLDKRGGDVL